MQQNCMHDPEFLSGLWIFWKAADFFSKVKGSRSENSRDNSIYLTRYYYLIYFPVREGGRGGKNGKISYVACVKGQLIWRPNSSVLITLSLSVQLSS